MECKHSTATTAFFLPSVARLTSGFTPLPAHIIAVGSRGNPTPYLSVARVPLFCLRACVVLARLFSCRNRKLEEGRFSEGMLASHSPKTAFFVHAHNHASIIKGYRRVGAGKTFPCLGSGASSPSVSPSSFPTSSFPFSSAHPQSAAARRACHRRAVRFPARRSSHRAAPSGS